MTNFLFVKCQLQVHIRFFSPQWCNAGTTVLSWEQRTFLLHNPFLQSSVFDMHHSVMLKIACKSFSVLMHVCMLVVKSSAEILFRNRILKNSWPCWI